MCITSRGSDYEDGSTLGARSVKDGDGWAVDGCGVRTCFVHRVNIASRPYNGSGPATTGSDKLRQWQNP